MGAKCNDEPKFDRAMAFSPHKGMDLAKICISKMVYFSCIAVSMRSDIRQHHTRYTNNTHTHTHTHTHIYIYTHTYTKSERKCFNNTTSRFYKNVETVVIYFKKINKAMNKDLRQYYNSKLQF